jgi:hypothetical protein
MTHEAAGGLLHPRELRIAMHEMTRPEIRSRPVRMAIVRKGAHHLLGVGPSKRQPIFALDLLPTENHARTGSVPLDGGDLNVILV